MQVAKQNLGKNPSAFSIKGKLFPHPRYDGRSYADIGVVVLEKDAPEDWLPVKVSDLAPAKGQEVLLAGFGDLKLKGDWPVEALAVHTKIFSFNSSTNLITYRTENGRGGECHGDSGGPMFIIKENYFEVIGATHGADPNDLNGECVRSGTYTYIKPYVSLLRGLVSPDGNGGQNPGDVGPGGKHPPSDVGPGGGQNPGGGQDPGDVDPGSGQDFDGFDPNCPICIQIKNGGIGGQDPGDFEPNGGQDFDDFDPNCPICIQEAGGGGGHHHDDLQSSHKNHHHHICGHK